MKDGKFEISDYESFLSTRFKLAESEFKSEYFSALNEKDALKYVGKVMEFADTEGVRENKWVKDSFVGLTSIAYSSTFEGDDDLYDFCRTCPETFQKKKIKKTVERWLNVYDKFNGCYYKSKDAAKWGQDKKQKLIACVKLTGEYEVLE